MFGFDNSEQMIKGFLTMMQRIQNNHQEFCLTHKEIRSLARCSLCSLAYLYLPDALENEIRYLLGCISLAGLPHYDRSMIAQRIITLIENWQYQQKFTMSSSSFDI